MEAPPADPPPSAVPPADPLPPPAFPPAMEPPAAPPAVALPPAALPPPAPNDEHTCDWHTELPPQARQKSPCRPQARSEVPAWQSPEASQQPVHERESHNAIGPPHEEMTNRDRRRNERMTVSRPAPIDGDNFLHGHRDESPRSTGALYLRPSFTNVRTPGSAEPQPHRATRVRRSTRPAQPRCRGR